MAETINKLIITIDGVDYEFDGGGGGQPGPHSVGHDELKGDSVGTENIIDGAVEEQDLNDSVKDRMTVTHDASTGGLRIGGYAKPGNIPADNSQDVGQGGGEDNDEEVGFDTGVDDGNDDI